MLIFFQFKLQPHERDLSALTPTANSQPLWESYLYVSFTENTCSLKSFAKSSCNSVDFQGQNNNWLFMGYS